MMDAFNFINNGGVVAWLIVALGGVALYFVLERVKTLYFDCASNGEAFYAQVSSLVLADKIEEAIKFCDAHPKSPLAHVVKGVLERSDRDEDSIHQILDVKYSEVMPRLRQNFGYLMMLSNVATLMGLLGTIHGLMISFDAVSFADPSQKQTILTQGIAMYMAATFLGLAVAIPTMFAYAFLQSRQSRIFDDIIQYSQKVVDLLASRGFQAFHETSAYPGHLAAERVAAKKPLPPPTARKSA